MVRNSDSEAGIKLFVAGIPSGINLQLVVEFFGQYGKFQLFSERGYPHARRREHISQGHCILLCANYALAQDMISQKTFLFLGRTLSVTQHRTGIGLIVQNKRLNKCRVIFKKVPSYMSEDRFREELVVRCGALQALFQFKPTNPIGYSRSIQAAPPRYHVYSAVFLNKCVAKRLIGEGVLELSDRSRVIAEKFQKPQLKKRDEIGSVHPNFEVRRNFPQARTISYNTPIQDMLSLPFGLIGLKPSSKHYFKAVEEFESRSGEVHGRYNHKSHNLRINYRKPNRIVPLPLVTLTAIGTCTYINSAQRIP